MKRRTFIASTALTLAGGLSLPALSFRMVHNVHREICENVFATAAELNLARRPIGEVVIEVGKLFKGSAYQAHTLEEYEEEQLIVNLEVFDCVTLVENTLALARCIKKRETTFEAYKKELQTIRYRDGIIDGYPSRLHYFSDWIYDNVRKGVVRDVSEEIGNVDPIQKEINFISAHRDRYNRLAGDDYFQRIKAQEQIFSQRGQSFIPKGNFHMYESNMKQGDILAFCTNIRGLDIQHTALAVKVGEKIHALHAPMAGGVVEITSRDLMMYMTMHKRITGLMVARPVEV